MQPTLTQEAKDAILEELKSEDIQNHMSDDGHAAIARAMEIVESFPVSDGWIPVTERLPERYEIVLIFNNSHLTNGYKIAIFRSSDDLGKPVFYEGGTLRTATH